MKIIKQQYKENKNIKVNISQKIREIIKNSQNDIDSNSFYYNHNNIQQTAVQDKKLDQESDSNKTFSLNQLREYLESKYSIKSDIGNGKKSIAEMIIDLWNLEKDDSLDFETRNHMLMIKFYDILKAQEDYYEKQLQEKDKIIEELKYQNFKAYQNQYTNNQYKGPEHQDQIGQFYQLEHRKQLLPKEETIIEKQYGKIRHCGSSVQYQGNIIEQQLWEDLMNEFQITEINGGFNIVVFDPPWTATGFNLDYKTLNDSSWTKSIPIQKLQKSGFIFIWVTNGKLEQAQEYMKLNGYKRVDMIAWIKMKTNGVLEDGIGFYLRHMFELCIVGAKEIEYEELFQKYQIQKAPNVIISQRQQSSRKPDSFYKIVEALAPNQICLEIFGRYYNQGLNWVTVGNESIDLLPKENTPKEQAKQKRKNGIQKKKKISSKSRKQ